MEGEKEGYIQEETKQCWRGGEEKNEQEVFWIQKHSGLCGNKN